MSKCQGPGHNLNLFWWNNLVAALESVTLIGLTPDQVAAKAIGQDTPLPSIELTVEEGGLPCGPAGAWLVPWLCQLRKRS